MERAVWHILAGESRSRAEKARVILGLGEHAEVYDTLDELLARAPSQGVVLAAETGEWGGVERLIAQLAESRLWLPVVVTAHDVEIDRVVSAMTAGALDYLALPCEPHTLGQRLRAISAAAGPYRERRRAEVEAMWRLAGLSPRESQVLDLVSRGLANKDIARDLEISPRTVEIHRANMMLKIGAGHTADAVRIWLLARPDLHLHDTGLAAGRKTASGARWENGVGRPMAR